MCRVLFMAQVMCWLLEWQDKVCVSSCLQHAQYNMCCSNAVKDTERGRINCMGTPISRPILYRVLVRDSSLPVWALGSGQFTICLFKGFLI